LEFLERVDSLNEINYALIVSFAFIAIASPGPATLAILGTSMKLGRKSGLFLALGVLAGSLIWSVSAAFGLAILMQGNAWLFEIMRFLAAIYLLFLSIKSLRSAFKSKERTDTLQDDQSLHESFLKGLLIHITNPKAILFFASLYSIGIPVNTGTIGLISVILSVAAVSSLVFIGYAIIFSTKYARMVYLKSQRFFEGAFSVLFGAASIKILFGGNVA
ncbi:LysE family translocator, partial [Reinekea sp.]|uniref:LysE family translocator n=1 Tax=Reinekea sp. TaxID=1970455 RepID=UPI002A7F18AA